LKLLELVGIRELGGVDLRLRGFGARLDHGSEDVLLLLGIALHGRDQVGNEVGAALILVLHVAPARLGLLLESRDDVVAATRNREAEAEDRNKGAQPRTAAR